MKREKRLKRRRCLQQRTQEPKNITNKKYVKSFLLLLYMKITQSFLLLIVIFFIIIFTLNKVHIENMTVINVDKSNKEYMDMLISMTSIFGGIFVIVAILALSTPITLSNPRTEEGDIINNLLIILISWKDQINARFKSISDYFNSFMI
jgi:NAD/NADP transhydrogenase alpha subunit